MAKTTLQTGTKNGEAQYVKYVENIIVKLTENAALFPDLDPPLADLEDQLSAVKKAQADAAYRDKRFVVIKNQTLAALKLVVYHLSMYVERKANGDAAIILAAGFIPSKDGAPFTNPAPKPKNFVVEISANLSGIANLRVANWKSVLLYQFEYRKKNGNGEWNRIMSSKGKLTLTGLEPVQEYEFRVAYIGRNPLVTYSDVVSSYIF